MQLLIVTSAIVSFVLCKLTEVVAADPLCQNKVCQSSEVCRVVETCSSANSCSYQAICLSQTDSNFLTGGCSNTEPLLEAKTGGGYELRTCFTSKQCADGFYCSTALQDVSSRCCRASTAITKAGSCPVPEVMDRFFCVDECLSDADCGWDMKCCQNTNSCTKKTCKMADPCSLKTCPSGQSCIVDPDYKAVCMPDAPPTPPTGLELQPTVPSPPGGSGNTGTSVDPLCRGVNCPSSQECRVVETCNLFGTCSQSTRCVPTAQSSRLSGGCTGDTGEPLLVQAGSGYNLRTCSTANNCADGFYCSTALADASSRCCRAAAVSTKAGSCPAPDTNSYYFCVDECRSDADCGWEMKCCRKSTGCSRNVCIPPDPCSLKTCPSGYECIVDPDNNAACSLQTPPSPPSDPLRPQSPWGGIFWDLYPVFQQQVRLTCPSPGYLFSQEECQQFRQCGFRGARQCPRGTYCCATVFCGNICRRPISY